MSVITLPVIVVEKGGVDLRIFETIEEAQLQLKSTNVRNDVYEAFDAQGRCLSLDVVREERGKFLRLFLIHVELVRIRQYEDAPAHEDDLRRALVTCLEASDPSGISYYDLDTRELISRVKDAVA